MTLMRPFLLFRIYGAIAAWGKEAVGEQRPVDSYPSRSAIFGLLAAALGVRREEQAALVSLDAALGFAVSVLSHGELMRDFHTIQSPTGRGPFHTRRRELLEPGPYTVLSSREYRVDALYHVALWELPAAGSGWLERARDALSTPLLMTYLGRKACPPSMPYAPAIIDAVTLTEALASYGHHARDEEFLAPIMKHDERGRRALYWEHLTAQECGIAPTFTSVRRDRAESRKAWQFSERIEFHGSTELPAIMDEEAQR